MPTFAGNGSGLNTSSFAPLISLPTGVNPVRVVVADLDGDGKPDLIMGNIGDNSIWIYRNISSAGSLTTGSFAPPVILSVPAGTSSPFNIALADLDGDGKLDIVAADGVNNLVSVFHNNCTPGNISAATFGTRVDFATAASPVDVEVMDIDGDGKPDLVTANNTSGTISILRNTSVVGSLTSNSFAPKIDITTGSGCFTVATGDLDGDGIPDLVTANSGAFSVSVLRNLSTPGTISFAPIVNLPTLQAPFHVSISDLDGDGKQDLSVVCYFSDVLSVFRNISSIGSLSTNSFAPRVDFPLAGRGHRMDVGDLEGDGKLDIAAVTELNSTLSVFRNLSTPGSFTTGSLSTRQDFGSGSNPASVAICDLDGDGRPDVIFCNNYDNTISIYQNIVPFRITTGPPTIVLQPVSQAAVAGTQAIFSAAANGSPSSLQWYFGTNLLSGANTSPLLVAANDTNAGNYSVVFSNSFGSATSAVAVLSVIDQPFITTQPLSSTNVAGTTASFTVSATGTAPLSYRWRKNSLGLNDNGHISGSATNTLTLTNVSSADVAGYSVIVSNAAGSVTSLVANLTVLFPPSILVQPVSVSDFAGTIATFSVAASGTATLKFAWLSNNVPLTDGGIVSGSTTPTLTLTNISQSDAATYSVFITNAIGSVLSSNAVLTVTTAPIVPTITSFNPGLASAGTNVTITGTNFSPVAANDIVFFGSVQSTVTSASVTNLNVVVPAGAIFSPITVTVNGLTAYSAQSFLPTFAGNGSGITKSNFGPLFTLGGGAGPVRVVVGDLDGDGKPDLIVGSIVDNTISIYRNISTNGTLTPGSFAPRVILSVLPGTSSPFNVVLADLDGDGKLDIIAAGGVNAFASVFHNGCTPGNITAAAFGTRVDYPTGAGPNDVEVIDIDGDGKPDLVSANSTDGSVSILRNTSVVGSLTASSFAPKIDIMTGSGCFTVALGDLDGDGLPDLATANSAHRATSLLLRQPI